MAETGKMEKMEKDWSVEVTAGLASTSELAKVTIL